MAVVDLLERSTLKGVEPAGFNGTANAIGDGNVGSNVCTLAMRRTILGSGMLRHRIMFGMALQCASIQREDKRTCQAAPFFRATHMPIMSVLAG